MGNSRGTDEAWNFCEVPYLLNTPIDIFGDGMNFGSIFGSRQIFNPLPLAARPAGACGMSRTGVEF